MRTYLQKGTIIQLESLDFYKITSESPIGEGGGGIIYSAIRLRYDQNTSTYSPINNISYALKECFPISSAHSYVRNEYGEILPENDSSDSRHYLEISKQMQLAEQEVSSDIYKKGFRITPVLFASKHCRISSDLGHSFHDVSNTFTVMESLHEKGASLKHVLSMQKKVTCIQALSILRQTLYTLDEVHNAGYLYLDIQAGNIFVKGNMDGNSEIITLIDFGSARKLNSDGKTAPIKDRVLFSTEGYSAPEMLLHNDGTLRLTCAADLFSVGYLFLCMITGKNYSSKEILSTKNGNYISGFRQKKLDCPKHLLPFLKKILIRSLCIEPSERYSSAKEMLDDVEQLFTALSPSKSSLYSVTYDAFVCYRHGEIDSAVAKYIQQKLEHFRVPKGVTTKPGRKPIQRVFVDEGELSSCADFGLQIREALKNSEYLIVVCSPATPESPWVNLEIETFLEYHDRSHILAVLTDGEPEESFPQLLKKGKDVGEVLAADARGTTLEDCIKRIKKDAILRLVAPILGTTFDGLKQRRQAYVFKRTAIVSSLIMSILTMFLVFSLWQNSQIKKQYNESRKNQAKALSAEALSSYKKGNITEAIEQVLTVLPEDETDEALVPEQLYALNKIVAANNGYGTDYYPYKELMNDTFSQSSMSKDTRLFVGINDEGCALFIDPLSGEILNRLKVTDLSNTASLRWIYAYAIDENTVILYGIHDVILYQVRENSVISSFSNVKYSFSMSYYEPAVISGSQIKTAIYAGAKGLIILNLTTKEVEDSVTISHMSNSVEKAFLDFSPDAETLFIGIDAKGEYDRHGGLYAYSTSSHQLKNISPDSVSFMKCVDDHNLAVIHRYDENTQYSFESWLPLQIHKYCITLYNATTFSCIFSKDVGTFSNIPVGEKTVDILLEGETEITHSVLFWIGPIIIVYNINTRSIMKEYSFESNINDVIIKNNAVLIASLQNGSARSTDVDNEETGNIYMVYDFDASVERIHCIAGSNRLLLEADHRLLWLSGNIDTSVESINTHDSYVSSIGYQTVDDIRYRTVCYGSGFTIQGFDVFEAGTNQEIFHFELPEALATAELTIEDITYKNVDKHTLVSFWLRSLSSTEDNRCIYFQVDITANTIVKEIDLSSYAEYLDLLHGCYDDKRERLYFIRKKGGVVYFDITDNEVIPCENAILANDEIDKIYLTKDGRDLISVCGYSYDNSVPTYNIIGYDTQTQTVFDTGLTYAYESGSTDHLNFYIITGNSSRVVGIYDGVQTIDLYDCDLRRKLSSISLSWNNDKRHLSAAFFNSDQELLVVCPSRVSLFDVSNGALKCMDAHPDTLIGAAVAFPTIDIIAEPDSSYFALRGYGQSAVTSDGALLNMPIYIYRYENETERLNRICDIAYGLFDPITLETIFWPDSSNLCYTHLHTFNELVNMASALLSENQS